MLPWPPLHSPWRGFFFGTVRATGQALVYVYFEDEPDRRAYGVRSLIH